jgi:hypothetical protein
VVEVIERRTLIRRRADSAQAGVLQGGSPLLGEVVELPCRYCHGSGYWIGGDEEHLCWCQQPDADVAVKP